MVWNAMKVEMVGSMVERTGRDDGASVEMDQAATGKAERLVESEGKAVALPSYQLLRDWQAQQRPGSEPKCGWTEKQGSSH